MQESVSEIPTVRISPLEKTWRDEQLYILGWHTVIFTIITLELTMLLHSEAIEWHPLTKSQWLTTISKWF